MNHLQTFVKIMVHLCAITLTGGAIAISLYFSLARLTLAVPAMVLLLFEVRTGRLSGSSSLHFSAATAAFFVIFYLTLFGMTCPPKENLLGFALLVSAIWLIGRFGFLLGRVTSKKKRAAEKQEATRECTGQQGGGAEPKV
ncbi:MAG: hypothetical protein MUC65_10005 [Pontiellaceae bacterium]|jgi:hypothetical protein|nr:hypothetical protein [Pontiellaceae bacterium]